MGCGGGGGRGAGSWSSLQAGAAIGLLPGDVIVGIGTDPVTSFGEFKARIDATPAGAFVPLKVMRGNATLFLPLPVAK